MITRWDKKPMNGAGVSDDNGHGVAFAEWSERARRMAPQYPRERVGTIVCGGEVGVCIRVQIGSYTDDVTFATIDVPSGGNCLYQAVWQAAKQGGMVRPLGVSGVEHVFSVRVMVARCVVHLLKSCQLERGAVGDIVSTGGLIAQPNQYAQFSGLVPMMAMSYILRRTIVTLSTDGVTSVAPHDFSAFHCAEETEDPVVIYHCKSGNVLLREDFASRNHYTATRFDEANMVKIKQLVERYRSEGHEVDSTMGFQEFDTAVDEVMASAVSTKQKRSSPSDPSDWTKGGSIGLSSVVEYADVLRAREVSRVIDREKKRLRTCYASVSAVDDEASIHEHSEASGNRAVEEAVLASLDRRALVLTRVTPRELDVLAHSQNFAKSPRLALLYYHCCSNNPSAFVHNDERLLGPGAKKTVERLERTLPKPSTEEQIAHCQVQANKRGSGESYLTACASCCEIIKSDRIEAVPFDYLPASFRCTEEETSELERYPKWIFQDVLQVLEVEGVLYHLNPELVPDKEYINLCTGCAKDPRKYPFSIASGHDYGRPTNLPELNGVAAKVIAPARCFGLELALNGQHSTGHAICFPSDGPVACSRVLPCTENDCLPRVTFIGPEEVWRVKMKKYRKLYSIPCEDVYKWLNVLQHTHRSFAEQRIVVEDTLERRAALREMEAFIEGNVVCQNDELSRAHQDRMQSERYGTDLGDPDESEIVVSTAAILKPPDGERAHSVVDTMLEMINPNGESRKELVIPVQREGEPVVEWTSNGKLISCVFPELFMLGGERLPEGSWGTQLVNHLMNYYDGRFEKNTTFIALLFNQLQRHSAVRRAAKVGASHSAVLERFGSLVNSQEFHEELQRAKDNPKAASSRRLNASLLRILSLVGGAVPFSPFERAATRPKIAAMRYRYGVPQHWVTLASPEHDNLLLHRIARLRVEKRWNDPTCRFAQKACRFSDLPNELQQSAKARLAVSSQYPALTAQSFDNRFRVMIFDVMRTTFSSEIKVSRHYGERHSGAYGDVAGHCSIVEAQGDGRLHSHSLVYGSSYTPQLLTRISCHVGLRERASKWLDSVSCASFRRDTHDWLQSLRAKGEKQPRAFEIELPDVRADVDGFFQAAEYRAAATNIHTHSFTCRKGARGKYMCRLARPAGIHESATSPLVITRLKGGNLAKGIHPVLLGEVIDDESSATIDQGYDVCSGKLLRERLRGPLVWELRRPAADTSVVETNLTLAALTLSHTNSSIINGEDSGDSVEQYQQAYMTKDQAALNGAIPMLLSAVKYVAAHPSNADDRDTDCRKGKFLATRAVNGFSGAHEWPHSVMAFALMGYRSFICSDSFWYIFPWALHKWIAQVRTGEDNASEADDGEEDPASNSVEDQLYELIAMANNDIDSSVSKPTKGSSGGTRSYRVGERLVFVSQVESYVNRGGHFADFSPLEFECIVDVLPVKKEKTVEGSKVGRVARPGFPFAATHPLFGHFVGFIRMKMHTAVFGGRPPPIWKEGTGSSSRDRCTFAQYALCTFTAWKGEQPEFRYNEEGLIDMCKQWDHSEASLIHRQRYIYVRNLLQRGHRCSTFESQLTDWRNRGADLWKDHPVAREQDAHRSGNGAVDGELGGILDSQCDVYALLQKISSSDSSKRSALRGMQEALLSALVGADHGSASINFEDQRPQHHGVLRRFYNGILRMVASRVQVVQKSAEKSKPDTTGKGSIRNDAEPFSSPINVSGLSPEQSAAVLHVVSAVGESGRPLQTRTMLHGAGGTGKSFVVRRICEEIEARGYKVVSTCPTGAGACQLSNGQTFHSAFKCLRKKNLSAQSMELLKTTFDDRVVLIIVDEVSMFSPSLLALLDDRLRQIYGASVAFGGRSILLVGDFSQLQVVSGMSMCKAMYVQKLHPDQAIAKKLFASFRVMFLIRQERARDCSVQQELLSTMRSLPVDYPAGDKWSQVKENTFFPLTREVVRVLTTPLTCDDVAADASWIENSVILVTGNDDRAAMNAAMATVLAKRKRVLLFRWRKQISEDVEAELDQAAELLYNEDERPALFGYFFKGARGQILDNANGNVSRGIANGTLCRYHSIAWDDDTKTKIALELVESATQQLDAVVNLPFPPDFINVTLLDRDGNPIPSDAWPDTDRIDSDDGTVVVPIGIVASKAEMYHIRFAGRADLKLHYAQHAVEMAMAMTIWKAQGATFDRVILLFEGSTCSPAWQFEHLYVALSRVRSVRHIRCVPLSFVFNQGNLRKKRPDIYTVRWRMDLDSKGFWKERTNV